MDKKILRMANVSDAAALLAIYAPYVENTGVSFEYTVPTTEEFAQRIAGTLQRYPYITCEVAGVPVGYAYASSFRARAAYAWCVETSIYVSPDVQGMGVGKALYTALLKILLLQGICTAYACITHPNIPSESFHTAMGFKYIAVFPNAGYKQGAWHGISWFEKRLEAFSEFPLPPATIQELDKDKLRAIFIEE